MSNKVAVMQLCYSLWWTVYTRHVARLWAHNTAQLSSTSEQLTAPQMGCDAELQDPAGDKHAQIVGKQADCGERQTHTVKGSLMLGKGKLEQG